MVVCILDGTLENMSLTIRGVFELGFSGFLIDFSRRQSFSFTSLHLWVPCRKGEAE